MYLPSLRKFMGVSTNGLSQGWTALTALSNSNNYVIFLDGGEEKFLIKGA